VMKWEEVENTPNVVTGNVSIKTYHVKFLFDSITMHLFISTRLVKILGLLSASDPALLNIALPDGKAVHCKELYIDCPIQIQGHNFLADLYGFDLTKFDVILGIDWLSKHEVHIDCLKRKISLRGPNGGRVVHKGKPLKRGVKLI